MRNIRKLHCLSAAVTDRLSHIWPQDKRQYRRNFELLRRSYVESRYSPHYEISAEQLQWLFDRIALLREKAREICPEHIAALPAA